MKPAPREKTGKQANRTSGPGETGNPGDRWLSGIIPPALFLAIAFALYGSTFSFDYTWLDDHTLILERMEWLQTSGSAGAAFTEDVFHSAPGKAYYYRPLLTLSFIADAMAGGGAVWPFRLTNILLHAAAAWLLFRLMLALRQPGRLSFALAGLFLIHPLNVQVVAWIPGRNDSLLALFVLGSALAWIRYHRQGRPLFLFLHLLLFGMALLTKESAVALPVLLILWSTVEGGLSRKQYMAAAAGWIAGLATWMVIRQNILDGPGSADPVQQLGSLFTNLPAVLSYLGKMVFPFGLAVFPVLRDMWVSIVAGAASIALLSLLAWFARPAKWHSLLFGAGWLFLFLAPALVTINSDHPNFSEHRAYLSLAGLFLFTGALLPPVIRRLQQRYRILIVGVVAALFTVLALERIPHFRDRLTFWKHAVATSPSSAFSYNNLGAMYFLGGDLASAEANFGKALKMNMHEPMANGNMGLVLMKTGRSAEAEPYLRTEVRINPAFVHGWFNLGILCFNTGRQEEGIGCWERVLAMDPSYRDAYDALLFAYGRLDRHADLQRIEDLAVRNGILERGSGVH